VVDGSVQSQHLGVEHVFGVLYLNGQQPPHLLLAPVLEGATVVGDWYFKGTLRLNGATGLTDAGGTATLTSFETPAKSGDVFRFVVTDVVSSGYVYDPGQGETEGSIAVE